MRLPQPGDSFDGRYRVERVLGEGGAGTVFAASDARSGQRVALKLLKPEGGTYEPQTVRRFEREVEILGRLRSPYTVAMLDHGRSADGLLYVVFEFIDGRELSALLAERRLDGREIEHVLRQLLDSLREAHGHGLLHRDLKPENILVYRRDGDPLAVKLLDFGIARAFEGGSPAITRTGELIGTPRYMSPEQLTEKPLTPASDLYSLGLIALEMALGRDALHGGAWMDQVERLMSGHVFSVPELERIGPHLHAVITKMSARKPEHRYPSAAAVLQALAPPPARERAKVAGTAAPQRTTRTPYLVGTAAGVVIAVVVFAGYRMDAPPDNAPLARPPPAIALPPAPQPAPTKTPPSPPVVASPAAGRVVPASRRSIGCGQPTRYGGKTVSRWTPRGSLEQVRLPIHVPAAYDPDVPLPMVVLFHVDDVGEPSATEFMKRSRWSELADEQGFLLAANEFQGDETLSKAGRMAWALPTARRDVRERIEEAKEEFCIDTGRIYAVGTYFGGRAVQSRIRCEPWVAAIATNSHLPDAPAACADGRIRPFFMAIPLKSPHHATASTNCDGTKVGRTLDDIDREWSSFHACSRGVRRPVDDGDGTCSEFLGCASPLMTCHVDGGNPWPGFKPRPAALDPRGCDGPTPNFPTARLMWEFFDALPPLEQPD